jgi:type I restriction enzyme, S subunit
MPDELSPYREYRDPGLPWLGAIPSHWEVRRNGRLFSERNQTDFADLPILEVSLKTGVRVRDFGVTQRKQVISDRSKYKRAAKGDIAYNMMRLWQGAVGVAPVDGLVSPAYVVARPKDRVDSRYYAYLFRTDVYKNEVNKYSRGIVTDRNRLYWDEFKQIPSVFPPIEEQRLIANFLDHHGREVHRFIRNKRRVIDLLSQQKRVVIDHAMSRGLHSVAACDQGQEQLCGIPTNWMVRKLKYLVRNVNDQADEKRPDDLYVALEHMESWTGRLSVATRDTEFDSQVKRFEQGDILFGKLRPYLAKVYRPNYCGVCVSEFLVLRSNQSEVLPEFLERKLRSSGVIGLVYSSAFGAKMPRAEWSFIGNIPIAFPPDKSEQQQILSEVSGSIAGIDLAIGRASREIELTEQYRARLIADLVAGALNVQEVVTSLEALKREEGYTPEPLDDGESNGERDADGFGEDEVE